MRSENLFVFCLWSQWLILNLHESESWSATQIKIQNRSLVQRILYDFYFLTQHRAVRFVANHMYLRVCPNRISRYSNVMGSIRMERTRRVIVTVLVRYNAWNETTTSSDFRYHWNCNYWRGKARERKVMRSDGCENKLCKNNYILIYIYEQKRCKVK